MRYLLDSNACIQCIRTKGNPKVAVRLGAVPPSSVFLSAVVAAELFHGALRSGAPARHQASTDAFVARFTVLPFDEEAARRYAAARAILEARGHMIGHFDLMIAATALAHGLTVVTHNTGEFSRVPGLATEDWEA
jgi:tRNA(fMet)-specific endonuclease VapC